jgi:hypothetical protein
MEHAGLRRVLGRSFSSHCGFGPVRHSATGPTHHLTIFLATANGARLEQNPSPAHLSSRTYTPPENTWPVHGSRQALFLFRQFHDCPAAVVAAAAADAVGQLHPLAVRAHGQPRSVQGMVSVSRPRPRLRVPMLWICHEIPSSCMSPGWTAQQRLGILPSQPPFSTRLAKPSPNLDPEPGSALGRLLTVPAVRPQSLPSLHPLPGCPAEIPRFADSTDFTPATLTVTARCPAVLFVG